MYFQHKGLLCVGIHLSLRDHHMCQALSLCLTSRYLNPCPSTRNHSSCLLSFVITSSGTYRFTLPLRAGMPVGLDAEHTHCMWSYLSWFYGWSSSASSYRMQTDSFSGKTEMCISTLVLIEKERFGWVIKGRPCTKTCRGDARRGVWYIKWN